MIPLIVALTFNFSGVDTVVVDSIEVNHLHDGNGNLFFTQIIFWDVTNDGRVVCQGYRVAKQCIISGDSVYIPGKRIYTSEKDIKVPRYGPGKIVRFTAQSESWTDYDPELEARNDWPMWRRSVK